MSNTEDTTTTETPKILLVDVPLENSNSALNVMISFMTIAQKRGAFTLQESAKLWECIKFFTGEEPIMVAADATADAAAATADATADASADTCADNITIDVAEVAPSSDTSNVEPDATCSV